ncbi:MAG: TIGR00341 family protein [[Clostridium] fimetarium]|nr:TIGR00341 family protein [Alistipes timonensis]MCM1404989.1 TIGR00341 family protein [[Clostridium] fimetarium]
MSGNFLEKVGSKLQDYFTLNGFLLPQEESEKAIREGVSFRGPNILILVFAIFIASLGLNTNSTAVIIGAMLISPLMGPIIGIGLAIGIEDFDLLKRSARNLCVAAGFSIITSTVYFLISPVSEGHSELLARTSPTIYDVFIGFFGGFAGIVAIAAKSKGNVIPGVAIATALMPPLCTVGFGLATWQLHYFLGALYLFLINSIYIALATFIGVKLMKFTRHVQEPSPRAKRVRKVVYAVSILTLLPSVYLTYDMLRQERFEMNAGRFVQDEFNFPSTQVLSHTAKDLHGDRSITVTLIGKTLPQDSLTMALASKLRLYGLEGTRLNIIQGDSPRVNENTAHTATQMFEYAQQAVARKQVTIDSLEAVMAYRNMNDTVAATLAPELKVIFPQVADIAVTKAVFGSVANNRLDTVNVALVRYSKPMTQAQTEEFTRYLQARLRLKSVTVQPMR